MKYVIVHNSVKRINNNNNHGSISHMWVWGTQQQLLAAALMGSLRVSALGPLFPAPKIHQEKIMKYMYLRLYVYLSQIYIPYMYYNRYIIWYMIK